MSDQVGSNPMGGVGLPALLGLLFVGLKLGGVIAWPWLWVLAPFWIPFTLAFVVMLVIAVAAVRR